MSIVTSFGQNNASSMQDFLMRCLIAYLVNCCKTSWMTFYINFRIDNYTTTSKRYEQKWFHRYREHNLCWDNKLDWISGPLVTHCVGLILFYQSRLNFSLVCIINMQANNIFFCCKENISRHYRTFFSYKETTLTIHLLASKICPSLTKTLLQYLKFCVIFSWNPILAPSFA